MSEKELTLLGDRMKVEILLKVTEEDGTVREVHFPELSKAPWEAIVKIEPKYVSDDPLLCLTLQPFRELEHIKVTIVGKPTNQEDYWATIKVLQKDSCSGCGHVHVETCEAITGYDHMSGDHFCDCPGTTISDLTDEEWETLYDRIVEVRDRYPRVPNDAGTEEIMEEAILPFIRERYQRKQATSS